MNSSNIVLVFCAFAIFSVLAEDPADTHSAVFKKCAEELGVDFADLDKFNKGELAGVEKWKCYPACLMKSFGLMKEDGTIDKDNIPNTVPADNPRRDEIIAGFQSCSEKVEGTDTCEKAASFGECTHKKELWGTSHE